MGSKFCLLSIFKIRFVVGKLKSSYQVFLQNRVNGDSVPYKHQTSCSWLCSLLPLTVFARHACDRSNCLMWKRTAGKALRGLIAKLIWQTEKRLLKIFVPFLSFQLAVLCCLLSHSCWLCCDGFLPCRSKLPAALCLPLVRLLPSFLHPFYSHHFFLAEALWWP